MDKQGEHMSYIVIAYFAFMMIFGGTLLYEVPGAMLVFYILLIAMLGMAGHIVFVQRTPPTLGYPAVIMLIAGFFSTIANPEIINVSSQVIGVWLMAFAALVIASQFESNTVMVAFLIAGVLWSIAGLSGLMSYNTNIAGIWLVFLLPIGLQRIGSNRKWALAFLVIVLLIAMAIESRTAVVALLITALVYYKNLVPKWGWYLAPFAAAVIIYALFVLRPDTFLSRFSYWVQIWQRFDNPMQRWFGFGPGGLYASGMIIDPVGGYPVPHAHNLFIQVFAELGEMGLASLVGAGLWINKNRPDWDRWQVAILGGMLVYCMFDFPLYFPGVLVMTAVIAGVRRQT
jgi:hypothetical protein